MLERAVEPLVLAQPLGGVRRVHPRHHWAVGLEVDPELGHVRDEVLDVAHEVSLEADLQVCHLSVHLIRDLQRLPPAVAQVAHL
eukprot:scaffold132338_cov33-Phaeocystis_antarctica.AAC.1